ncbi:MAG: hypothetical protein HKO59_06365 [Phycisphaerales bacterium]|nr:hypothetical protein [Phycisphaerae bacterium]NNF43900.1 hypothetical protein [Phycisphaerales bacterium]NNM25598.1 hypothetical protein [Phycisphaerales bacterium]
MANATRKIGLSLGADLCWPTCYEHIVRSLDLAIPHGGDTVGVDVERVTIEPFRLRQPCTYDVVLDRVTHWYSTSREWIKKAVLMDDLYVLNNPWSIQSMEKQTSYCAMMRLGMPVPETWLVPPKEYDPVADLEPTLTRYARMFEINDIAEHLGYPLFMKPYDGGAWVGVNRIDNADQLRAAYEASGKRLMHLQAAVEPFDLFVRCVGIGPQLRMIRYNPSAPLHERYEIAFDFLTAEESSLLSDMTLTINAFFGWDFNSCEALRQDRVFAPIDFANGCPDSQVTSLHYHFPWLVKAMIRWSVFCAVTKRPMRKTLDWAPFYEIADRDVPFRERLRGYADIARERLEADRFAEFCDAHLAHLDEITWEFFGSEIARDAVRAKVQSLFPPHEVEPFTEHFWGLLQFWRSTEADRLQLSPPQETP